MQITIFTNMFNFFKNASLVFKSTKFVTVLLLFATFTNAAISVNATGNAEIAGFIESESNRILQIPESAILTLTFQTAQDSHGRANLLFFWGEREITLKADYILSLDNAESLRGTVKADSSWLTGYCGMLECRTKPMPAQQRIDTQKALVSKILLELNGRFHGLKFEPSPVPVDED